MSHRRPAAMPALLAAAVVLALAGGVATAATRSTHRSLKACARSNGVLVVASKSGSCPAGSSKVTISPTGKQGLRGKPGKPGKPGKNGKDGSSNVVQVFRVQQDFDDSTTWHDIATAGPVTLQADCVLDGPTIRDADLRISATSVVDVNYTTTEFSANDDPQSAQVLGGSIGAGIDSPSPAFGSARAGMAGNYTSITTLDIDVEGVGEISGVVTTQLPSGGPQSAACLVTGQFVKSFGIH